MNSCDYLLTHACTINEHGLSVLDQAIAIKNGIIVWCGANELLPETLRANAKQSEDCQGRLITPGLIDCHTHLVYAGNRASEFQLKLQGASYAEIAQNGGGIRSTVLQTRAASEEQLICESLPRILDLKQQGVTTVEIKSGYGLEYAAEVKMLRVAKQLGVLSGLRVKTTFLGAHTIPSEYKENAQRYVDVLCNEMLPEVSALGLADAVDVFCESIAFSLAQTEQIFLKAHELKLPIKCHAEQLSNIGASALAVQFGALSCDHLEWSDAHAASLMAQHDCVAVLLPGAHYFLREDKKPPVELFRAAGVKMAIATDCNPGSSPTTSLQLMMSMACQIFALTPAEVLAGVTANAAKALGIDEEVGVIAVGKKADLVLWSVHDALALCYYFAYPLAHKTMIAGQWINSNE